MRIENKNFFFFFFGTESPSQAYHGKTGNNQNKIVGHNI
jgi:hypothetical protein